MFGALKKMFGGGQEEQKKVILAPVSGTVIPMSQVADPTFSQEILGKGVAIVPDSGVFVAPADGEVAVMFETKHAVSIKADCTLCSRHVGQGRNCGRIYGTVWRKGRSSI